ncbi:MAG: NUDIX domain-containing protein [Rikenellaceae bacterium]
MNIETNHSLSVDCAIFGYDGEGLKVLLIEQRQTEDYPILDKQLKLPGSMIFENETVPDAAERVLVEKTGLDNINLKPIDIFSDPKRVSEDELEWVAKYHNINTNRVITVGYYALIAITPKILKLTTHKRATWHRYEDLPHLVMDHNAIIRHALLMVRTDLHYTSIAFDLLPKRFTIRALQNLFSAIMGIKLDNRNFRKKILGSEMIIATGTKERGVAHKPAEYFKFNISSYRKSEKQVLRYL